MFNFPFLIDVLDVIAVLCGIALMSKVEKSGYGNMLSAFAVAIAVFVTMKKYELFSETFVRIAIATGCVAGIYTAKKVRMIQMPETVALLNASGGAASAAVAVKSIIRNDGFSIFTGYLAIAVGVVTFAGSVIAALKLARKMDSSSKVFKSHQMIMNFCGILLILFLIPALTGKIQGAAVTVPAVIVSLIFAYLFSIRVGGADMPIVISLLNSTSGLAASIAGMAVFNPLLISIGAIVGASGLILTHIMCKAMNRSLKNILLGTSVKSGVRSLRIENPENSIEAEKSETKISNTAKISKQNSETSLSDLNLEKETENTALGEIKKAIIIPGYGMALSQAQGKVKELMTELEKKGCETSFAIHPVAGRMPGHMNVLLAEVDIDYEKFKELEEANEELKTADLAIIVGANDVVNPAANTAEGTPIYGMPVLNVSDCKKIIICNYDTKPGYAKVENPLYENPKAEIFTGDAKESLEKVIELVKKD